MNARKLLTSLAVTIMLTDMLLVLLAFVPATHTSVFLNHASQPAVAASAVAPGLLTAGGAPNEGPRTAWSPWGAVYGWAKNCWKWFRNGDEGAGRRCRSFRSRQQD
ncbi:MAG: hypothetical protein AB1792_07940 [Candidatus Zixiibacteriota bacterium]